jgi:hypothetical protein
MVALLGHSHEETGSNRSAIPKGARQSSTLPEDERALRERSSDPLGPEFCIGFREVSSEA